MKSNGNYADSHLVPKLYSSKALKILCAGRSPDLSPFWTAFPHPGKDTVAFRIVKTLHRTYSSGSVQDLHLIPSSSNMPKDISEPMRCKDTKNYSVKETKFIVSLVVKIPLTSVKYSGRTPSLLHSISTFSSSDDVLLISNPNDSSDGRILSGAIHGSPFIRVHFSLEQIWQVPEKKALLC